MYLVVIFVVLGAPEPARTSPTVRVHPIIPLENLTLTWAYYNKYLRQHVTHLIDSLPLSVSTQNGNKEDIVTPKDIRKGVSEALDMMPFANRTAFELQLDRLRAEASSTVPSNPQPDSRPSNETILEIQNISNVGNSSNTSTLNVQQDSRPGRPTFYVRPQTLTIESFPTSLLNVSESEDQPESSYYSYGFQLPPPRHFPTKVSHKVVPMPLPVVRVQPVYYPVYRPIIHERPVPIPHYIPVPRPVPQPFPQYIPVPRPVPQPIPIPRPMPYPVPKPYPVPVPLPPKAQTVIQLGIRIERPPRPSSRPLRDRVFQFLIPLVGGAISSAPPPPQAIPVPVPQPYPVPVPYFPPGMTGVGQGSMYNPQYGNQNFPYFNNGQFPMTQGQPGQGSNYAPRQPMPQMPQDQGGSGDAVEIQRRSREHQSKSSESEKKSHKSSLMRFILNVDD